MISITIRMIRIIRNDNDHEHANNNRCHNRDRNNDNHDNHSIYIQHYHSNNDNNTHRLQCSSLLVMTYFLLRGYNILPKEELLLSLWVIRIIGTRKRRRRCLVPLGC